LREFERERDAEHRDEMQSWKNAQAIWKADHEKIMGDFKKKPGNRDATQVDLDALGAEPPAPLSPNLTATEPTLEGLHKLFAAGQPSLGIFSDEGGQFLGGHGMSADNRLKTVAGLSALWGGDAINRTRAGDGASTLYGRRLAAHLMVQPIAARPLLADPVATGQGFLARFLIADPTTLWVEKYDGQIFVTFESYFWTGNSGNRKARAIAILRRMQRRDWVCGWCRDELPIWRRADARYCCEGCRKRAARQRRKWAAD